ncbi:MAG TPA: hypothetical protein VFG20_15605 [Planctomycetaceae bacterium]|jgi:hypothetical protein|nr:hypothetical protein [Planctomycetaceae bacterium]
MPEPEEPLLSVTSPWPVTRDQNPYLHNLFVLLEINPDRSQREFNQIHSDATKKITSGVPWEVHGRPVTDKDTARALHMTSQTADFISERLLVHTTHELDPKAFQEALQPLDALPLEKAESLLPLPVRNLTEIARRLPPSPEMILGEPQHLPREQLLQLFRPNYQEEQIYDL